MSYAFDVMSSVYNDEIRPRLEQTGADPELVIVFGFLIEAMHSANHEAHSKHANGDAVNKDANVTKVAHRLDAAIHRVNRVRDEALGEK